MNARKCCYGLAIVVLALGAAGVAGAGTSFHGVIKPNGHAVWIDTAIVGVPPRFDTLLTPGWGSDSVAQDTFDFPDLTAWPSSVSLRGTVNGVRLPYMFPAPVNGTWYNFNPSTPPQPQAMFYGTTGVEESGPAIQARPRLLVSPSVVTARMTVRLQGALSGRPVVEVLDAAGNLVRSLACATGADGLATATWQRDNALGVPVPAGVYFCRYAASGAVAVRKVVVAF